MDTDKTTTPDDGFYDPKVDGDNSDHNGGQK